MGLWHERENDEQYKGREGGIHGLLLGSEWMFLKWTPKSRPILGESKADWVFMFDRHLLSEVDFSGHLIVESGFRGPIYLNFRAWCFERSVPHFVYVFKCLFFMVDVKFRVWWVVGWKVCKYHRWSVFATIVFVLRASQIIFWRLHNSPTKKHRQLNLCKASISKLPLTLVVTNHSGRCATGTYEGKNRAPALFVYRDEPFFPLDFAKIPGISAISGRRRHQKRLVPTS